jgi:repressor LexA
MDIFLVWSYNIHTSLIYYERTGLKMTGLGNKKIMSDNINYYLKINGKERKEASKEIGVSYSTFTDWANGTVYPRIDKIEKMANYFGVQKSDLIEKRGNNKPPSKGILIPILGRVPAGVPTEALEDILWMEEISEKMAKCGEYFGLLIDGDSMEPKISKGDVVIVRQQNDVNSGDIAIVVINGSDATCKKIIKHNDGISLVSTNPKYDPRFFNNKQIDELPVVVIGRVVELRAKF